MLNLQKKNESPDATPRIDKHYTPILTIALFFQKMEQKTHKQL